MDISAGGSSVDCHSVSEQPRSSNEIAKIDGASGDPIFSVSISRGFTAWLNEQRVSLAVTTYQVGKLFLIGLKPDGKLWVFNRNIGRCLGLAASGSTLWVAGDSQIFRFVDALERGQKSTEGHDALYVPQVSYYTGDLDVHDLAVNSGGSLVFVNTLFNCLATVSESRSFVPVWRPPFVSKLAAEDRCHLNGIALEQGWPTFVTAISQSDTFDAWRDRRADGGIVIDVDTNEIISTGLSMPHSPRWHKSRLWLHESGSGQFGAIEVNSGKFEPLCFCPGYLRGLSFIGNYAVMGLSKPRQNKTFSGLRLDAELEKRKIEPRCGIYVVDLATGDIAHSLSMEGVVSELYDVIALPGKSQPAAVGPFGSELRRMISVGTE